MASRANIFVIANSEQASQTWHRFVAALCFIEFYAEFIFNGQWWWNCLHETSGPWDDSEILSFFEASLLMLRAITFWGLGRALWQNRTSTKLWLRRAILCSLLVIVVQTCQIYTRSGSLGSANYWGITANSGAGLIVKQVIHLIIIHDVHLPWIMLLISIWIIIRRDLKWGVVQRQPWTIMAAAWAFSCAIFHSLMWWLGPWNLLANILNKSTPFYWTHNLALAGFALPVLAAIWLLVFRRFGWLIPLIIAIAEFLNIISYVVITVPRIITADGSYRHVLNQGYYNGAFVWWVSVAGPWLLIAIYAWRVPTRIPAEDGSPYPRRYCGNCYYNLYGLDANRCPECGTELVPPKKSH